jgi:hypothetical protein
MRAKISDISVAGISQLAFSVFVEFAGLDEMRRRNSWKRIARALKRDAFSDRSRPLCLLRFYL